MLKFEKLQSALMNKKQQKIDDRNNLIERIRNDTETSLINLISNVPFNASMLEIKLTSVFYVPEDEQLFFTIVLGFTTSDSESSSDYNLQLASDISLRDSDGKIANNKWVPAEKAMIGNCDATFFIPLKEIFDGLMIQIDLSGEEEI